MSQKQHSGFKIYPYGIGDLSLSSPLLLSVSLPLFMVKFSANFLLITLMMVLLLGFFFFVVFLLTSAVCFLTLHFGNSRKCTRTRGFMHAKPPKRVQMNLHTCALYVSFWKKKKKGTSKNPSVFQSVCQCARRVTPTALCDHSCTNLLKMRVNEREKK